ncbi:MAG: LytS/YhcK type 5TM receptor domain-containing protein [bacterium]
MEESTLIGLVCNAALLVILGLVFDIIVLNPQFEKLSIKILTGIGFGLIGMAVMKTPWEFMPGVFFDTRSVLLSLGGLFFGTVPTLIAVSMTGVLRFFQGGMGASTGIGLIVISGALGVIWRHKRRRELDSITQTELYLFGIIVHVVMLLWMFTLPWPVAKDVLIRISLPVMLLFPVGTVLLGKLMITRLQRMKEGIALLESEARWRSLTENSPDHILMLDTDLIIQFKNAASHHLTLEKRIGTPLYQYETGKEKQDAVRAVLENVLRTGKPDSFETETHIPENDAVYFESRVVPRMLAGSSKIVGLTVSSRNITERKKAEDKLRISEERFSLAMNAGGGGLWDWHIAENEVYYSPGYFASLGYLSNEIPPHINAWIDLIHPEDQEATFTANIDCIENRSSEIDVEFRALAAQGDWHWIHERGKAVARDPDGRALRMIGTRADITDRKEAEELIRASLREKEILLHEIHHRVKNNMQVIASLLNLQMGEEKDSRIKTVLKESQGRIQAMSTIHEALHQSKNLSEINLNTFLSRISQTLLQSYAIDPDQVSLQIESPDMRLHLDKANPLGLIINELLTNSLKYAFPNGRRGEISVIASLTNNMELVLTVSDDGIGFPENMDWRLNDSLGLKLVRTLVENQLNGSIAMINMNGTRFDITFNLYQD